MQNSDPITWKIDKNAGKNLMFSLNNMENSPKAQRPSQDVWKFTPVSYVILQDLFKHTAPAQMP